MQFFFLQKLSEMEQNEFSLQWKKKTWATVQHSPTQTAVICEERRPQSHKEAAAFKWTGSQPHSLDRMSLCADISWDMGRVCVSCVIKL